MTTYLSTLLAIVGALSAHGAEMVVSKEEYTRVTNYALAEVEALVNSVDLDCVLTIESGRQRKVRLEPVATPGRPPRLCLVNGTHADAMSMDYDGGRVTVLMLVNSVEYLREEGNWLSFLNKAAYCRKTQRSLYIWIGDLDSKVLNTRHHVPWLSCAESSKQNTLNIYKTIALLATFKKGREVRASFNKHQRGSVMYLDADAWFSDTAFEHSNLSPEDYLNLSSRAFLFGNQNRVGGPKIPMNGGLLALRDTSRARRFLALWFFSRCGDHDQLPLWASLFAMWTVDANASVQMGSTALFSRYDDSAHPNAINALVSNLATFRRPIMQRDPHNSFDGGSFKKTQLLDIPLELPGVLVLPSAPVSSLPALRSDIDKSRPTFCCHTRIDKDEAGGQCRGSDICSRSKCMPFLSQSAALNYVVASQRRRHPSASSRFFSFFFSS